MTLSPEGTYTKKNRMYLGIYFLAVLVVQFGINVWIVNAKCGGDNIGVAAAFTLGATQRQRATETLRN